LFSLTSRDTLSTVMVGPQVFAGLEMEMTGQAEARTCAGTSLNQSADALQRTNAPCATQADEPQRRLQKEKGGTAPRALPPYGLLTPGALPEVVECGDSRS
jgi:hypothetical protein